MDKELKETLERYIAKQERFNEETVRALSAIRDALKELYGAQVHK